MRLIALIILIGFPVVGYAMGGWIGLFIGIFLVGIVGNAL